MLGAVEGSPDPSDRPGEGLGDATALVPASLLVACVALTAGAGDAAADGDADASGGNVDRASPDAGDASGLVPTGNAIALRDAELGGRVSRLSMPSGISSSSSSALLSSVSLGRRIPRLNAATLTLAEAWSSSVRFDAADPGREMAGRGGGAGFQSSLSVPDALDWSFDTAALLGVLALGGTLPSGDRPTWAKYSSSLSPETPDMCRNPRSWNEPSSAGCASRSPNTDVREAVRLKGLAKNDEEGRRSCGGRESGGAFEEVGVSVIGESLTIGDAYLMSLSVSRNTLSSKYHSQAPLPYRSSPLTPACLWPSRICPSFPAPLGRRPLPPPLRHEARPAWPGACPRRATHSAPS